MKRDTFERFLVGPVVGILLAGCVAPQPDLSRKSFSLAAVNPNCAINNPIGSGYDPAIGPPSAGALAQLAPLGTLRVAISTQNSNLGAAKGCSTTGPQIADGVNCTVVGTSLDMACRLAAQLNLPMVITNEPSPTLLARDYDTGLWDIGFGADPVNSPISQPLGDTRPKPQQANSYVSVDNTCMVPVGSSYQSVSQLNVSGLKIAVLANATKTWLLAHYPTVNVVTFATNPLATTALKNGQVDAFCTARSILEDQIAANWTVNGVPQGRVLSDNLFLNNLGPFLVGGQVEGACYLTDYVESSKTSGLIQAAITRSATVFGLPANISGRTVSPHNLVCSPVAQCQDVLVEADAECQASASINFNSYDVDGDPACTESPDGPFSLGSTTSTLTCVDDDNQALPTSCTATVTVVDTTPPSVTTNPGENGFIATLSPDHSLQTVSLSDCIAAASDNCDSGGALTSQIIGVTSNEAASSPGSGDTPVDVVLVDASTVQLRAERSGRGGGRVYTIFATVADAAGNATHVQCKVQVPHDQSGAPAVDSRPAYCIGTCN